MSGGKGMANGMMFKRYKGYLITREPNPWGIDHPFCFVAHASERTDERLVGSPISLRYDLGGCDSFADAEGLIDRGFVVTMGPKDRNILYFVSDKTADGKTHDIEKARVFSLTEAECFVKCLTQSPMRDWKESDGGRIEKDKGNQPRYFIRGFWDNSEESQKKLDELYPSPRKKISRKQRLEVYGKCQGRCAYCGREITFSEMQVDHVVSHLNHMGKDEMGNYLPACRDCNLAKGADPLEKFRSAIKTDFYHVYKKRKKPQNWLSDRITKAYGLDANPEKKIVFYFEKGGK